jgi:hypothetical protein
LKSGWNAAGKERRWRCDNDAWWCWRSNSRQDGCKSKRKKEKVKQKMIIKSKYIININNTKIIK